MICCLLAQTFPVSAVNSWPESTDGSVSSNGDGSTAAKEQWARFRQAFPYHIQTLAFHKASRTLLISEPPPHVTPVNLKEALQRYNPALAPTMSVETSRVGVDGWVKDILLQLPPMDEVATREALDAIQQHVFHTNYKAYVMSLPVKKPASHSDKLDLTVAVAEVEKWLFKDREPLSSLYGGGQQTAGQLLATKKSGVFFSNERGLVIWSVNRTKPISSYLVEARQFALDSDMIVGAVNAGDQILIVGRERMVPVNILPPLRTETIMLLASVGDEELQQSYERTHIFAGRFNETKDWAPIFLSDALIDTEYGSLLNITDQLLKRWSMNGVIEYDNFNYPDPKSWSKNWCFNKPLYEEVGATSVTFNWNTKGVGYTTEIGGRDFFAINRSGSLPTSYFEGANKTGFSKQEEQGYQCFASFGDPNLARVVQYASLYQIFQRYPVRRDSTFVKTPPAPQTDVLTRNAENALSRFMITALGAANNTQLPLELRQKLTGYAKQISPFIGEFGVQGIREVARVIAHPRMPSVERQQLFDILERLDSAQNNPALYTQRLNALTRSQQIKLWAFIISNSLLKDPIAKELILLSGGIDLNRVKDDYIAASKRNNDEWIRTASAVISRPLGGLQITGGHNVNSVVTRFRTSQQVPSGTISTVRAGNRLTFLVNPADAGKIPKLVRKAAILSEGKPLTVEFEAGIRQALQADFAGTPPPPIRPIKTALLTPDNPPPGRGFTGGEGWQPDRKLIPLADIPNEARTTAKYGDVGILVDRQPKAEGFEYTITTAEGKVIKAYSTPSAIDAVVGLGRDASAANPKVSFVLKGFNENEARGFLYNADLRVQNGSLTGFAKPQTGSVAFAAKATEYRLPGVSVGEHSLRRIPEGRYQGLYELGINFDVPAQVATRPPLKVKLQMFYRNALNAPRIAGVKNAIRRFFNRPVSPDAEMNALITDLANELRTINPRAKNILTVWEQDTSGVIIVELRLPQSDDGNIREKSQSE
jgi:hypothetical protein